MKTDKPIINTLMDTDRYKLSMQKVFLHHYPAAYARYRFKCRSQSPPLGRYADEIREQIRSLDSLTFSQQELDYVHTIPSLSGDYVDFLRIFRLDSRMVFVENRKGELIIEAQGPVVHVLPFELYILPIVQEICFKHEYPDIGHAEGKRRLDTPGLEGFRYADFGGRRRASRDWHDYTVERQAKALPAHFNGTSNMWLAMKHGLTPIGTMAHEYLQAFQALGPRLLDSQPVAKISDSAGKCMCEDKNYLTYLMQVFKIPNPPADQ